MTKLRLKKSGFDQHDKFKTDREDKEGIQRIEIKTQEPTTRDFKIKKKGDNLCTSMNIE